MNHIEETALRMTLAKHREASARADDTIDAQRETIAAQREVIDLLHAQIGRMENQLQELRAAL